MRPRVVAALVLALAVLVGASAAAVGSGGDLGPAQTSDHALAQEQPEPDNTITRIELAADGSATWRITFRTRLATDEERAEYERFQDSFRADTDQYLDPFRQRMTGVVDRADERHDREMRATAFEASTTIQEVPRRWGVVTFQFRWNGFAATEGDRVVSGDVFDGGFYIGEDDVLEISAPDGYTVAEADPTPDELADGVLEWRGREDFSDGRPRVIAEPSVDETTPAPQPGGEPGDGESDQTLAVVIGSGIGGFVLVLAALYGIRTGRLPAVLDRRGENDPDPDEFAADGPETTEPDDGGGAEAASSPDDGDESELLTDEDRVRRTLREQDGRMKQSAIVEELDWSKSKTSRVLSTMAENGSVEKLRIGRENVIDLLEEQ